MAQPQPQGPGIGGLPSVKADGSRQVIHPSDVHGRFINRRRIVFAVLIAIYVVLPLIHMGGRPAVHLDVAARRFYLFGEIFNAQDFWLVLFLLTTAGFSLLFATAWLGRVWCGWACPQTVFLEGVYRQLERWIDGPRERRQRMAAGPWTVDRALRMVVKHGAYIAVSLFLAHVALSMFVSVEGLAGMIREGPAGHSVAFAWAMAVTGALYFNFAWFREQMCVVLCPYGRLQSALHDRDSIIIGYDMARGEPRGRALKVKPDAPEAPRQGDCVDCRKCVTACPTGIDIRNGLQMDCVACAQCVDACDEVMEKLGRPKGLIRYDSLNGLAGLPHRIIRSRLLLYGGLLLASLVALGVSLARRTPFEANLLRVRGIPYIVEGTTVRNHFQLHLVNKNPVESTLTLRVDSPVPASVVIPQNEVKLGSLESFTVPLFVTVERANRFPFSFSIEVTDEASKQMKRVEARFLGPSSGGR